MQTSSLRNCSSRRSSSKASLIRVHRASAIAESRRPSNLALIDGIPSKLCVFLYFGRFTLSGLLDFPWSQLPPHLVPGACLRGYRAECSQFPLLVDSHRNCPTCVLALSGTKEDSEKALLCTVSYTNRDSNPSTTASKDNSPPLTHSQTCYPCRAS